MNFSLPLYLFMLAHLLGNASAGTRTPGQQRSERRRLAREVASVNGQCSQCAHLLSSRIKEKQELERVRHRFMAAFRNSNTPFALPNARSAAVAMDTNQPHGTSALDDIEKTDEKPFATEERAGSWAPGKVRENDTIKTTHRAVKGGDPVDLDDYTSGSAHDDVWPVKKNARGGPDIVSFSNVLIPRRRRNVLHFQFKLSSTEQDLQNLEVVRARLWILFRGKSASSRGHTAKSPSAVPADNTAAKTPAHRLGAGRSSSGGHPDIRPPPSALDKRVARAVRGGDRIGGGAWGTPNRKKAAFKVLMMLDNGTEMLLTYMRTSVKVTHWQKLNLPVSLIQQRLHAAHPSLTLVIRCSRCGAALQSVLPTPTRGTTIPTPAPGVMPERRRRKHGSGLHVSSLRQGAGGHSGAGRLSDRGSVPKQMSTSELEPPARMYKRLQHLPFLVINTRIRKI